jgi:hypothetical protein
MRLSECSLLLILGILAGLAVASVATTKMLDLKDDNEIEESVEAIIEEVTGITIDLTPKSPEKR